jgi:hypothetical protein
VEYLYKFMEYGNLPITPEGKCLMYKAVRSDWMDKYSGKFRNMPGDVNEVERNEVDDDPDRGCSHGFHVGTLQYVQQYYGGNDKFIICEVDPADVVSVPHNCAYQKVRTCKYKVLCEFQGPLNDHVASSAAPYGAYNSVSSTEDEDDDPGPQFSCTENIDTCPSCDNDDPACFHYVKRADVTVCDNCHAELCIDALGYAVVAPDEDDAS